MTLAPVKTISVLKETKPALASKSIWGAILATVPFITMAYNYAVENADTLNQILPYLPPQAANVVGIIGAILVAQQRVRMADVSPISGIVNTKVETKRVAIEETSSPYSGESY